MIKDEVLFAGVLSNVNEWWFTGKAVKAGRYAKKRAIFDKLARELESNRVLILSGPRRVGKSVLLHQLIQSLIDSGTPSRNIVYYSLDDPSIFPYSDEPVRDIIDYAFAHANGKKYVFLDEVQACNDWYKWVKSSYDNAGREIKLVLSGSSSMKIQSDANKYLRGRTTEFEIFPIDFREFLFFSGRTAPEIKDDSASLAVIQRQLRPVLEEYLLVGGFPEWFEIKNEFDAKERWLSHLIGDVPKKAIYEDIAVYFNIRNPKMIDLLLNVLAINQSKIISYEKINEVLNVNRATLLSYIAFLESSYLVLGVPVYGGPKKQLKAMKKFLFIDQGIRNAIMKHYVIQEANAGFIAENLVGVNLALNCGNITYWREQAVEVDFIANNIPIEVKYQNQVSEKDCSGVMKFLERFDKNLGVIITKNLSCEKTIRDKKIRFIPFWRFLLEGPKKFLFPAKKTG